MSQTRRDSYTRQLDEANQKLVVVEAELGSTTDSMRRLALKNSIEMLLKEIDDIDIKLTELDSENPDRNVRDRGLEKILQKIDFAKAKEMASLIKDKLNQDGGSVLFFLQQSKKQMGRYCVEEVLNVIMADQIVEGQIIGAYRRYSVDLGSALSEYNEGEFLNRLASHFELEASVDRVKLSQALREKIRKSIDAGTTIFLEIKSLDDLLEQEAFLEWFIQEFWQPLIDELAAVSQKYKSKFIVALIADSHILPDRPCSYFCEDGAFDCSKMLELSLPNWSVEDIQDWLIRFRTLSAEMKEKDNEGLGQVAKRIHRASGGTPESICVSLREYFL